MNGVLGAVGAAAAIEALAQGYPANVEAWVVAKTNGNTPVYQYPSKGFGVRALGFGVVAVVLTFVDDRGGELQPLAGAFAAVFLAATFLMSGPQAFANLGSLFGIDTASTIAGDVSVKPTPSAQGTATAAPSPSVAPRGATVSPGSNPNGVML